MVELAHPIPRAAGGRVRALVALSAVEVSTLDAFDVAKLHGVGRKARNDPVGHAVVGYQLERRVAPSEPAQDSSRGFSKLEPLGSGDQEKLVAPHVERRVVEDLSAKLVTAPPPSETRCRGRGRNTRARQGRAARQQRGGSGGHTGFQKCSATRV